MITSRELMEMREKSGLTLEEISSATNLSKNEILQAERFNRVPSLYVLDILLDFYGYEVNLVKKKTFKDKIKTLKDHVLKVKQKD